MNSKNLQLFFSSRAVTVAVILIAIAARIFLQIHFLNTDNDKSYQIQTAKNFLDGHGFSLYQVFAEDLSKASYVPLTMWPPGYSLLLSPFLLLFDNDFILATLLLDVFTCILFIIFSRKILFQLEVPLWLVNIYTLFSGLFLYSFCTASSSDFLCLTIYIIALSIGIKIAKAEKAGVRDIILLSLLLFLSCFIRYLFLPVFLVIPTVLLLFAKFKKNKPLFKAGIQVLFLSGLLVTIFLLFQYSSSGSAIYLRAAENGFYPENIYQLQPFLFSSFFNVEFFSAQFSKLTGLSFSATSSFILIIHNVFLVLAILLLAPAITRLKKYVKSTRDFYFVAGTISSLGVIALLLFLSLIYEPYKSGSLQNNWTYVYEGRYYAFPVFFLQQVFFILISKHISHNFIIRFRNAFIIIGFIIAADTLHNSYFLIKSIVNTHTSVYKNPESPRLVNYIATQINAIKKENPGKNVVVFPQPIFTGAQAGFYQNVPFYFVEPARLPVTLKTQRETVLLFILRDKPDLSKFITNKISNLVKRGQYNNYHFFTIYVFPG